MQMDEAYHFSLIRRALDEIDASDAPMSLDDLAAKMQMSPAHFQRVFSRWVGVSPKRYQQYLQLGHAKDLLRDRFSVLDTAHATGLSGGGRLHDMFVRWEAMSPGVYAAKGEGLTIYQGWFDGPFGEMLAMGTDKGLCGLAFTSECGRDTALADMQSRWPRADFVQNEPLLKPWIDGAVGGKETSLVLIGAPMQIKVWEALLQIPSGHVTTYSEIASAIGAPRAQRAVGTAVGRNPVSWLIPCHRALRKSGALGGYHWGLPVKRAMLAWEGARADAG
ncbi:bifunctional helix-turn-helix domain-containing protein/methylated-DNA--[protein]-cysteine S-methyltransferase [Halocynthiibacter styelae]|uniref:methylated-DNA--[protein]-cysteine S-methyltransferase n=1 Tax=Halocynthiibacter styelae TaxID=2761955 RepID=A0A8J7LLC4_9RHOB|nr:bifunctional helix-turn-helix domain-containing protein/methylated-DNA--[protein]-cysteine S-methyltransferase [Paenihalocynthiibacter styelae]MBI1495230.1 bifunctional helix-turn-helix domain-containing protein/methylated-DNA--[protein]-cysteine S-methyltransferase [Paenihalocynthiibacter styelae]